MLADCDDAEGDENLHRRDGSLLRKKQKQWAKERATLDYESWFPFGSPGGGAPNRSYGTPVHSPEKQENRPSSRRSNVDSGRWSGSENVAPSKEEAEAITLRSVPHAPCPCAVASTSAASQPSVLVPQPPQIPTVQCMPRVLSPASSFSPLNSGTPIPMQFVFSPNPFAQAVPIPVELIQPPPQSAGYAPRSVFPCGSPVRVLSAVASTPGVSDTSRAEISMQASSYTEHWANQLPLWGVSAVRGDELPKGSPNESACLGLSAVSGVQPLAVVHPMTIPLVASSHSGEQQFSPAQPSGADDLARKSMSESLTSLNSSSRRSGDGENKSRARPNDVFNINDIISDQIAAKRQAEAQRLEEERREALMRERDRRRSEERELEKALDEERKKAAAEEERAQIQARIIASFEKANKEAEMMRKARIFRHVLSGSEPRPDLERTVLGDDHRENVRVLKEVDSLERQRKLEIEHTNSAKKGSPGKIDANHSRRSSVSNGCGDDRPIKLAAPLSINAFYSTSPPQFEEEEAPLGFSRRGRQSVRASSSGKPHTVRRAESVGGTVPRDQAVVGAPSQDRTSLQCQIPVRLQKRIPPPANRPRGSSVGENYSCSDEKPKVVSKSVSVDATPDRIASCCVPTGSMVNSEPPERLTGIVPPCMIKSPMNATESGESMESHFPADPRANGTSGNDQCPAAAAPSRRRASLDALALISDIPSLVDVPPVLKRTSKNTNGEERAMNPLFQPVATRCRRSRLVMGNADVPHPSSSSGSASPPSILTEDESASSLMPNSDAEATAAKKHAMIERPSAVVITNGKPPASESAGIVKSPFKKILAESMSPQRHREDDLLSPEIRRKGDIPNSSKMRTSTANLFPDESDDGRASPVSPLVQRFNCKTSQYRSFNLKKSNEENRKILENLAQMRLRLKAGQEHIEKVLTASGTPPLIRSRTSGSVAAAANKRLLASP